MDSFLCLCGVWCRCFRSGWSGDQKCDEFCNQIAYTSFSYSVCWFTLYFYYYFYNWPWYLFFSSSFISPILSSTCIHTPPLTPQSPHCCPYPWLFLFFNFFSQSLHLPPSLNKIKNWCILSILSHFLWVVCVSVPLSPSFSLGLNPIQSFLSELLSTDQ